MQQSGGNRMHLNNATITHVNYDTAKCAPPPSPARRKLAWRVNRPSKRGARQIKLNGPRHHGYIHILQRNSPCVCILTGSVFHF